MNQFFDKIFYINLEKDKDRKKYMEQVGKEYNLCLTRFNAVNGKKQGLINEFLEPGQLGCALSHLAIYKQIIEKNWQNVMILEDDITMTVWISEVPKMLASLPKDWDVVWLGNSRSKWPRNTCSIINDPPYDLKDLQKISKYIYKFPGKGDNFPMGLYAYAVSNKGAKKILEEYQFKHPIDHLAKYESLEKYMVLPSVIIHCYDFGTNIAKKAELDKYDSFEFVWKNNKYHEALLFDMLVKMNEIFNSEKIKYITMFGSLLGAIRHKGLIPWDDDFDICVEKNDLEKIEKIIPKFFKGSIRISVQEQIGCKNLKYKIYSINGKQIPGKDYTWPFIDIFPYEAYNRKLIIYQCSDLAKIFLQSPFKIIKQEISSSQGRKITLSLPNNTEQVLNFLYGNNWRKECHSGTWNHQKEIEKKGLKANCNLVVPNFLDRLWLQFDDGPELGINKDPKIIEIILNTLNKHNICGIFALNGKNCQKYSKLIKNIHSSGHIIQNHTYNHENSKKVSTEQFIKSVMDTKKDLENITRKENNVVQMPYMAYSKNTIDQLHKLGFRVVSKQSRVGIGDYQFDADPDSLKKLLDKVKSTPVDDNVIIGLHNCEATARILDDIIKHYKDNNYTFAKPWSKLDENFYLDNNLDHNSFFHKQKYMIMAIIIILAICAIILYTIKISILPLKILIVLTIIITVGFVLKLIHQ